MMDFLMHKIGELLDAISEYLANRKGLLPIIGIALVIVNGFLQFIPGSGWLVDTDLLLHAGIVIAFLGILLAWAL
jgi:hypothetical protein